MGARVLSWWQRIRIHPVHTVLVALLAIVIVLIILSILGYIFNWGWTGLGPYISPPHSKDSDFQRGKTLWDWLQLLIIPAVLAVAGYVINLTISRGEQAATEQRAKSEREAAEKRAETEREIALDNQRETALKEYIDKMSELILQEGLLEPDPKKGIREIARIQTLTVLNRLDGRRKGWVLKFLNDSDLIMRGKIIINLSEANLSHSDLSEAYLSNSDLSGANLNHADLEEANLEDANLIRANLSNANLYHTNLGKANLSGAKLKGALLEVAGLEDANLENADLEDASLEMAFLFGANLQGANLRKAYLFGAMIEDEEVLVETRSLEDATLPDGSIHP